MAIGLGAVLVLVVGPVVVAVVAGAGAALHGLAEERGAVDTGCCGGGAPFAAVAVAVAVGIGAGAGVASGFQTLAFGLRRSSGLGLGTAIGAGAAAAPPLTVAVAVTGVGAGAANSEATGPVVIFTAATGATTPQPVRFTTGAGAGAVCQVVCCLGGVTTAAPVGASDEMAERLGGCVGESVVAGGGGVVALRASFCSRAAFSCCESGETGDFGDGTTGGAIDCS